jgi:hypothetical protein
MGARFLKETTVLYAFTIIVLARISPGRFLSLVTIIDMSPRM